MHGAADTELDALDRELVDDVLRVSQGSGKPVEFGDHESVTVSASSQRLSQSGTCSIGASESMVGIDQIRSDAEGFQGAALGGEILLVCGAVRTDSLPTGSGIFHLGKVIQVHAASGPALGGRRGGSSLGTRLVKWYGRHHS
jgi:hypothetical protein